MQLLADMQIGFDREQGDGKGSSCRGKEGAAKEANLLEMVEEQGKSDGVEEDSKEGTESDVAARA